MIAERLGRTVAELEQTITATELECWIALLEVEAHEAASATPPGRPQTQRFG